MPSEHFLYLIALLLVVGMLTLPFRRIGFGQLLGYAAAWGVIFGGLYFVFARNPEIQRYIEQAAAPRDEPQVIERADAPGAEVRVPASLDGHFWVRAEVNGRPVRFLVDTGATDVVLSAATAERVGIDTAALDFDRPGFTASGRVVSAEADVDRIAIGPIVRRRMPVSVIRGDVQINLLGMRYLRSLKGWRVEDDTLVLTS